MQPITMPVIGIYPSLFGQCGVALLLFAAGSLDLVSDHDILYQISTVKIIIWYGYVMYHVWSAGWGLVTEHIG